MKRRGARRRVVVAAAVLLALAVIGLAVYELMKPRSVRDSLADAVDVGSCASIENETSRPTPRWPPDYPREFAHRAKVVAVVACLELGPTTIYMRFASHAVLVRAIRDYPSVRRHRLCALDHEMFDGDSLDDLSIVHVCHDLQGALLPTS